jgi:hypothetical protein
MGCARLAKEEALAKLRVLQSGVLEGRLLDREEVRAQWAQAFATLRDRALGMADRIASRGAGRSARGEELRSLVDAEIRDLLETIR